LNADSNSPASVRRSGSAFFPSDPADARTVLRSKNSVRALSYWKPGKVKDGSTTGESDEVVCICKGQDDGPELVQCDDCHTWYHLQCIGIRNIAELGKEEDPWYCDNCAAGFSRTPYAAALSSEPTFVPTDDEPTADVAHDLPFFQASLEDSPMTTWSSSRPPTTPTRGERPEFPSGLLLNDAHKKSPSSPHIHSQNIRVNTTPMMYESFGEEEPPFDPTSTPSRGIKFAPQFVTPKNLWPARPNGLFQTPSKPVPGSTSRVPTGGSLLYSSPDETDPSTLFYARRNRPSLDDSPIRRTNLGEGPTQRHLWESPLVSRSTTVGQHLSLQESPAICREKGAT